ncbi:hypothetical protein ASPWEDRAFT_620702 [Aspergillus wentii DTO 134E9]|uniref:GST N-terminal domain-containing protein n=1 Tax=Aspergillus wentii DTO 134E9 TaxID=1073089 RepID=A0A1L9REW2_ASPWE|nr:uncharacterized protein ASPWEDRAFT_620702 [Aspergillus wentii DTO 134E9]KAI9933651.1 hypothetical protein MW887_008124 [Aspergillus wentii]OJJ33403.1 hypothetical protein ASPWEDRAFT_620702 [Aspergillus wentii DTO 134E9]
MKAFTPKAPWLLYAYPWQPFPRRLVIYLRERNIPSSLITLVPVSDVQFGDKPPPGFPPRPVGSLPILVIPQADGEKSVYIKQSIAIMEYIEETCLAGRYGFPKLQQQPFLPINTSFDDDPSLYRARHGELLALAAGLTESWNPVRSFGSGAGPMRVPAAAREMLRWTQRNILSVERWLDENEYCADGLRHGEGEGEQRMATIAEIILFQFFDFTKDCYGIDMTQSSGRTTTDVYGRETVEEYPRLKSFYDAFMTRPSARRHVELGDVPREEWVKAMTDWSPGVFE